MNDKPRLIDLNKPRISVCGKVMGSFNPHCYCGAKK
jgi:hypothetical protein